MLSLVINDKIPIMCVCNEEHAFDLLRIELCKSFFCTHRRKESRDSISFPSFIIGKLFTWYLVHLSTSRYLAEKLGPVNKIYLVSYVRMFESITQSRSCITDRKFSKNNEFFRMIISLRSIDFVYNYWLSEILMPPFTNYPFLVQSKIFTHTHTHTRDFFN